MKRLIISMLLIVAGVSCVNTPPAASHAICSKMAAVVEYPRCAELLKKDELDCLLRFDDRELSDWDGFRKNMFALSIDLKKEYCIPMSEVILYDALMKTVYAECKFKVGKRAINKLSDARGAIQWTRRTRRKLNVPNDIHTYKLAKQVPYIHEYFRYKMKSHKIDANKLQNVIDIYCIVFAPAMADAPLWRVVYSKGKAYSQNKGYDVNKDHKITKREIESRILRHYKKT